MIAAFPLQWPDGWKRTPPSWRRDATFSRYKQRLSVADGVDRLLRELDRMGIRQRDVVISTNMPTRNDGLPRSDGRKPDDPGAAAYWTDVFNGARRVMAIDLYTDVADNLAAIAATLEAMRSIERHGGAAILERAFTGFVALPAPGNWRAILGDCTTAGEARERYRLLALAAHPDRGGSGDEMSKLNVARDEALRELAP